MRANLDGSSIETWLRQAEATPIAATRPVGAWESRSIPCASRSIGRKRGRTTAAKVACCAPGSKSQRGNRRQSQRHRGLLRSSAGADRSRDRSKNRVLYWTDRGDPPRGNTVNRASIDAKPKAPEILITHLMEGIGIALDVARRPNVRHRFRRLRLFREARRNGRAQFSLRAGQSHRHRLRRNLNPRSTGETDMADMTRPIRQIAIIGTGVIGASWSALFLAKGLDVVATDVAPDAETALRHFVEAAWPALKRLGLAPGASQSRLSFTPDMPAALQIRRLRPGKRARTDRLQNEAVSPARRGRWPPT